MAVREITLRSGWSAARSRLRLAVLLLACLFAPSSQALSIGGFKNSLVTFLLEKISVPGEFEVAADEVSSPSNGSSVLKGVRVSDAKGVWFRAAQLSFSFSPSKLLLGQVQIDEILIDGGHLERLPAVKSGQDTVEQADAPLAWPRSPIAVNIPKVAITSMRISDAVLAQTVTFDATGSLRDEGDEQSLTLSVKRVDSVSGIIDLSFLKRFDDDRLTLKLVADEAAGGLVAGSASLPADVSTTLNIEGTGTPAKWDGQLKLEVDGMLSAQGVLAASWLQRIGVDLSLALRPGERLAKGPRLAIGEQAVFRLLAQEDDAGVIHIEQAQLDAHALLIAASGTFARPASTLDLAMDVTVDRDGAQRLMPLIQPLAFEQAKLVLTAKGTLAEPVIAGSGELLLPRAQGFAARNAQLTFDVSTADGTAATVSVLATSPTGPNAAYAKAFGSRVAIELATRRSGETIAIETAQVRSAALQVSASGNVQLATPTTIDLSYELSIPDVASLAALAEVAASGVIRAQGAAKGPLSELKTSGNLRLSRAVLNGQRLGRVDITHSTRIAEDIAGTARLKMASDDFGQGSASAAFRLRSGSLTFNRLQLDLLGIKANGKLSLPARASFPNGEFDFTVASLQPIGRLSGQSMSGRGRGQARLVAARSGESSVQAEFNAVRIGDMAVQRLQLDAKARDLASKLPSVQPMLSLRVSAEELRDAGDTRLARISLIADGPLSGLKLNADAEGVHRERAIKATMQASAALDKSLKTLQVDALQASYAGESMTLLKPMRISVDEQSIQIDDLDLSLPGEGRLYGWFKQVPDAARVDLQLANVPLRLLKVLSIAPITEGRLSGSVIGDTSRAAPRLDARLSMKNLRLDNVPADTGALAGQLDGSWDGRELSADLTISGPFDPAIKGQFRVPMSLAASAEPGVSRPLPVLDLDSPIEARLDWNGEVEPLMALLPIPEHVLAGTATIALRVAGTLKTPLPSGEFTLRDGRYENLVAGTILEDLTLESDFSDQQRVRFSLTGSDGEQGRLEAKGVVLPGKPDEMLDITARLENLLLVRIDAATVLSSANLSVKSSATALDIKGKVVVEQAEIRLLNPLPPSIVDLGEVRIAGQPIVDLGAQDTDSVVPVLLDIGIDIPGQTFVRGRGLDSEWGGALRISGSATEPSIDGRIESKRGVLELIGRAFDLRRGRVVFTGKDTIDPNLDLRLVREANGITGTLFIEGTGSRPTLRFTSNPALPTEEVLPRLLFGRSKQSLSGPEAIQLAAGLAALARGKEGVLDTARKALGVDVLRIESADDGSNGAGNLSVGRYATEKIYVGAKQSFDGQSTSVVVEIELPKNFVVDSEVGQNADTSVGITWRKDF
ncbi:MAG: translocation and assembly module TamB [Gammaproteobacteria bacterium]|jgi:translocation and assembly module TamB